MTVKPSPVYEKTYRHHDWRNYRVVYALADVQAYAEAAGHTWFADLEALAVKEPQENDTCQDCHDGYLRERKQDDSRLVCSVCGSIYDTVYSITQEIGAELTGRYASSGGVGRWFHEAPFTRIDNKHVIVMQQSGIDN